MGATGERPAGKIVHTVHCKARIHSRPHAAAAGWPRVVLKKNFSVTPSASSTDATLYPQSARLSRLHALLTGSRGQVDEFVAAMLESRTDETKLANTRKTEKTAAYTRTLLAQ